MKKQLISLTLILCCFVAHSFAISDFTQVAKQAIPAVVSIKVKQRHSSMASSRDELEEFFGPNDLFRHFFGAPRGEQEPMPQIGQGSGFIVSSDGYIVTNSHVVKDADEIIITLNDGKELTGEVVGIDPNTDIALIKIDSIDLPYLTLGDSDELEVGQWVVAIGNPLGLQASLTAGVVSAKGRNNLDITRIEDFIQTDAAINRGNSGGPLLNLAGDVIGMNTAIVSPSGGNMGIGFAIPSDMLKAVVTELKDSGSVSRGFMGVVLQPVDHELAKALDMPIAQGALVANIAPDSPAAKAGIKQGDVLLEYNQTPIKNVGSLRNAISLMKPNTVVSFSVLRDNETVTIPVTIGAFPNEQALASIHEPNLGIQVETLTPGLARKIGHTLDYGVIISRVDASSVASFAGIKKGAIILEVNREKVTSVDDFKRALKTTVEGRPVLLLIKQGDITRYISLK